MSSDQHGSTPAAWTGVAIVLVGFIVGGIGLLAENLMLFWVGVALGLVGPVVGMIMAKVGLGGEPAEER